MYSILENMNIADIIEFIISSSKSGRYDRFSPVQKDEERTIYSYWCPASRYIIDAADDFSGWHQIDTWQDAPYFGTWYNQEKLIVLTYAEGDWSVVVCDTRSAFDKELNEALSYYGVITPANGFGPLAD
jgi:hypothetical protein